MSNLYDHVWQEHMMGEFSSDSEEGYNEASPEPSEEDDSHGEQDYSEEPEEQDYSEESYDQEQEDPSYERSDSQEQSYEEEGEKDEEVFVDDEFTEEKEDTHSGSNSVDRNDGYGSDSTEEEEWDDEAAVYDDDPYSHEQEPFYHGDVQETGYYDEENFSKYSKDDPEMASRGQAAGLSAEEENMRIKITTLLCFVVGFTVGFFLFFGVGGSMRRNSKGPYKNDKSVSGTNAPTTSPIAAPPPSPSVPSGGTPQPPVITTPTTPFPPTTTEPTLETFADDLSSTDTLRFRIFPLDSPVARVDIVLPDQSADVYLLRNKEVTFGDICLLLDVVLLEDDGSGMAQVSLAGIDTILVTCTNDIVTGLSHYIFRDFQDSSEFPDDFVEVIDFARDNGEMPDRVSLSFGPGVGHEGAGTVVLYGEERFYEVSGESDALILGVTCPSMGMVAVPADELNPFTLFVLDGSSDKTVVKCAESNVSTVLNFDYLDDGTSPSTLSPSLDSNATTSSELDFSCLGGNASLFEFVLVPDEIFEGTSFSLVDVDTRIAWWKFDSSFPNDGGVGQVLSMAVSMCLPSDDEFSFVIQDEEEDGLTSNATGTPYYGSFWVAYNGIPLGHYTGKCNDDNSGDDVGANITTAATSSNSSSILQECGPFCYCSYEMLGESQGTRSECTDTCNADGNPLIPGNTTVVPYKMENFSQTLTFICPNTTQQLLDFRIMLDTSASDIAVDLTHETTGQVVWSLARGTLKVSNREIAFGLCLPSDQTYKFRIRDTESDGLQTFVGGAVPSYGSFQLKYGENMLEAYEGNCETNVTSTGVLPTACFNFCECSYTLGPLAEDLSGGCTTECGI